LQCVSKGRHDEQEDYACVECLDRFRWRVVY
jgi:hypothetical protein